MSEASSESIPKPPSSWMIEKQKRLNEAAKRPVSVSKPRPAPEDDILYQWRLARRLEKAEELGKTCRSKRFINMTDIRTTGLSDYCHSAYRPEQDHPIHGMDGVDRKDDFQRYRRCDSAKSQDLRGEIRYSATRAVISEDKRRQSVTTERESSMFAERKKDTQECNRADTLQSNVPAVCFIDEKKVPSHVHMMCDIVPCSKRMNLGSHDVVERQNDSNLNNHECRLNTRTQFRSPNIECQDDFQESSGIRVRDVEESCKACVVHGSPWHPGLTQPDKERKDLYDTSNRSSNDIEKRNAKPPLMSEGNKTESTDARRASSSLVHEINDYGKFHCDERVKTATSTASKVSPKYLDIKGLARAEDKNTKKPTTTDMNDQDKTCNSHQSASKDGAVDIQNTDAIGSIIGQVSLQYQKLSKQVFNFKLYVVYQKVDLRQ